LADRGRKRDVLATAVGAAEARAVAPEAPAAKAADGRQTALATPSSILSGRVMAHGAAVESSTVRSAGAGRLVAPHSKMAALQQQQAGSLAARSAAEAWAVAAEAERGDLWCRLTGTDAARGAVKGALGATLGELDVAESAVAVAPSPALLATLQVHEAE